MQNSKDSTARLIILSMGITVAFLLSSCFPVDSWSYKFTRIETEDMLPGDHKLIAFLDTPVVLHKRENGQMHSFVARSPLSDCDLDYIAIGGLGENWAGGWIDRCAVGAWDEEGKSYTNGIFGNDPAVSDLPKPNMLSWDGSVAVFHP